MNCVVCSLSTAVRTTASRSRVGRNVISARSARKTSHDLRQQCGDGVVDSLGALQLLARLVEEVDLVALLALGDVEAIRDEDTDGRDHEQPELGRVLPDDAHPDQRETGVDDRRRLREAEGGTGCLPKSMRPSEKEIAIRITSDWSMLPATTATSDAEEAERLSGSWWLTRRMNSSATTLLATVKLARLKASFSGDWRRWSDEREAVPATIESTTTNGGAKKKPTTSGSSLSEKE